MKVVEPSEIFVGPSEPSKGGSAHPNPWLRCIGRFFDYSLFFLLLWILKVYFGGQVPFGKYEHFIPFEFFVWIPIEAFLLSTWGTTPGKFLLKTKLSQGRGGKLDYMSALKRSFSVWFWGLGMGIPIVNFFCLLIAYQRLKIMKITSWDRTEKITVTHQPIASWRLYLAVAVAIMGTLLYYANIPKQPEESVSAGVGQPPLFAPPASLNFLSLAASAPACLGKNRGASLAYSRFFSSFRYK